MESEKPREYAPQPAINESYFPRAPPSYSQAVGGTYPPLPNSNAPYDSTAPPLSLHAVNYPLVPEPGGSSYQSSSQVTVPLSVGQKRCLIRCPNCNAEVLTTVNTTYQKSAHIACFVLCIMCCCLFSCIPYFLQAFKNINHYCPRCKGFVGTYKN